MGVENILETIDHNSPMGFIGEEVNNRVVVPEVDDDESVKGIMMEFEGLHQNERAQMISELEGKLKRYELGVAMSSEGGHARVAHEIGLRITALKELNSVPSSSSRE